MSARPGSPYVLALTVLLAGCLGVDRSVFDPRASMQQRLLPLEVHIIDPNVDAAADGASLLSSRRIEEARLLIRKDFQRNVFEPGEPTWGHAVVRVERRAAAHKGWLVASVMSVYMLNLVGFPIMSQTSDVDLDVEILDARQTHVARFTASGHGAEYWALYWGRVTPAQVNAQGSSTDFPGAQMVHAEALHAALAEVKRKMDPQSDAINGRLRTVTQ